MQCFILFVCFITQNRIDSTEKIFRLLILKIIFVEKSPVIMQRTLIKKITCMHIFCIGFVHKLNALLIVQYILDILSLSIWFIHNKSLCNRKLDIILFMYIKHLILLLFNNLLEYMVIAL